MNRNDLFVNLAKYAPTYGGTPKENFFTELVAYILNNDEAARGSFLEALWRKPPQSPFDGEVRVQTQATIASDTPTIAGKRPDLALNYSGGGKLLIECKVDAPLGKEQLEPYLGHAREETNRGRSTKVAVVSKSRNRACSTDDALFLREVLWREIADQWQEVQRDQHRRGCPDRFVMEGALTFMEENGMGPFEPFAEDEMGAATLWRSLQSKVEKVLYRLNDTLSERQQWCAGKLDFFERFPSCNLKQQGYYRGVLWGGPRNPPPRVGHHFWYFLGFIYGGQDWYPKPREEGSPECTALIGAWGASAEIQKVLRGAKDKLNSSVPPPEPKFEWECLEGQHVFLFRRQGLRAFLHLPDQAEALLDFLMKSHEHLEPLACAVANLRLAQENSG